MLLGRMLRCRFRDQIEMLEERVCQARGRSTCVFIDRDMVSLENAPGWSSTVSMLFFSLEMNVLLAYEHMLTQEEKIGNAVWVSVENLRGGTGRGNDAGWGWVLGSIHQQGPPVSLVVMIVKTCKETDDWSDSTREFNAP